MRTATRVPPPPGLREPMPFFRVLPILPALLAGCLAACGGRTPSKLASTPPPTLALQPASAELQAGQSLQMTLQGASTGSVTWSVLPATGGTITPQGLFTASAVGACTVTASLQADPTDTGSASILVVPAAPASGSTNLVLAGGSHQAVPGGTAVNDPVVQEPFQAVVSTDPSGLFSNRTGFTPPAPGGK